MRRTIQGDLGSVTLVPSGDEQKDDNPRHFMGEWEAADYLRSQFLADPADMTQLRALLDEVEGSNMTDLTDDEVLVRLSSHLIMGGMTLIDGGAGGYFNFGGAGGGAGAGGGTGNTNAAAEDNKDATAEAADAPAAPKKKKILIDVVIRLMYWNPVTGKAKAFPAGVTVKLMNGSSVIESKTTNAKGICAYSEREYTSEKPSLVAEFGKEYIDLDKNELVSAGSVNPGDTRRLLRMPAKWDSTKEKKFVDKRGGRFSTGKLTSVSKGQQGSKGSPWKIQVDYGWEKLWAAFAFYNPLAKKDEGVPYGGLLDVYSDSGFSTRVAGGTVIDKKKGLCYMGVWKKTDREKLRIRLRYGANAYLDLKKKSASRKILTVPEDKLKGFPGAKRRRHYPLPAEWRSTKQSASLGKAASGDHRKDYEKRIKEGISKGKPISFHLDDFVLVDDGGSPIRWDGGWQFTIFNHLMGILEPVDSQPFYTNYYNSRNLFAADPFFFTKGKGSTFLTRVVSVNRGFYDLLHKRTTSGDVIGARAAVLDDHPKKNIVKPLTSKAGNFTAHYFHDCALYKKKPLSHVLAYWSVRFRASTTQAADKVDESALIDFWSGTQQVKVRHEGQHPGDPKRGPKSKHKNYMLVPTRGKTKRIIKVCVHIEAREAAPEHTVINVHNGGPRSRDRMDLRVASFAKANYEHKATDKAMDKADKLKFTKFTYAHETGHAMGLHDEYIEVIADPHPGAGNNGSLWTYPSMAQYSQHYAGMPYSCEEGISMMQCNKAMRLRHYWQFCRFINETPAVQSLVGGVPYRIEYPIQGGPTLKYSLKNAYRKPYDSHKKERGVTQGQGKMDLILYKCGQDEMQRYNIKAGFSGVDSILVVRHAIHICWPIHHIDRPTVAMAKSLNTWALQAKVVYAFQQWVSSFVGWNNKPLYTLECPTGDFRCCLIYIKPHYAISRNESTTAPAGTQFKFQIRPHGQGAKNNVQKVYEEGLTGDTLTLTPNVKWPAVLRYMLGMSPIKVKGTGAKKKIIPITTIKPAEFNFLATWMTNQVGGAFKVKKH